MGVKIFVEGIADIKFLKDYISYRFGITISKNEIIETKGWSNISSQDNGEVYRNQMLKNSDDDGVNLIIFDADANFEQRSAELNNLRTEFGLEFQLFLWPNNHDTGDLETMLEHIINPNNQPIFDCWNRYEECLRIQTIEGRQVPLTTPARKTKIYGYLEALLSSSASQKKLLKERERNYMNVEHWNLDNEYLNPLQEFLNPFYNEN